MPPGMQQQPMYPMQPHQMQQMQQHSGGSCWNVPSVSMRHVQIAILSVVAFIIFTLIPIPFADRLSSLFGSGGGRSSWLPAPDVIVKACLVGATVMVGECAL